MRLSNVIRTLRNISQLIIREKDRNRLIQKSCDLLVEGCVYEKAWLLLLDEKGQSESVNHAGFGGSETSFLEQLVAGDYPECVREFMVQDKPAISCNQPGEHHEDCVMVDSHRRQGIFRCRLEYEGRLYGVLGAIVPARALSDKEEQDLFLEVSNDLAFALAHIEKEQLRKLTEERLLRAAEEWRTTFDTITDSVSIHNRDYRITRLNKAFARMVGVELKELIGRNCFEVVHGTDEPCPNCPHRQALKDGKPHAAEFFEANLGIHLDVSASPIINEKGEVMATVHVVRDITERKKIEEDLWKSEATNRAIVSAIANMIFYIGKDGTCLDFIPGASGKPLYTPEVTVGKKIEEIFPIEIALDQMRRIRLALQTGHVQTREYTLKRLSDLIYYEFQFIPVGKDEVIALTRDITERKRIQEQLMIADRLASIGELASCIAHEINNPLTGIIGLSELILDADLPVDVREDLKTVHAEAQRTAGIIKNLLTFARKQPLEKQPTDINDTISKVMQLRAYEQRLNNINITTRFAPDLPKINANTLQLQQVFLNIVINAEHFMTETHGRGTFTVTTERVGDIVRIVFVDNGPGIDRDTLEYIFDPFFTTKEIGKGTGLGLSICHGIIAEHGGRIYAQSKAGKGATFIIELPISATELKE